MPFKVNGHAGLLLGIGLAWLVGPARATIDLEWRPLQTTALVGQTLGVGLYAVSDSDVDQYFSAAQVIVAWDVGHLELLGVNQSGALPLFSSSFPLNDAFGLNEVSPPADGDGLWVGLAFPSVLPATPAGSLLTTLMFEALAETPLTSIAILASAGDPVGHTKIIGEIPNQDVLGAIGPPAEVTIVPEPASATALVFLGLWRWRGARHGPRRRHSLWSWEARTAPRAARHRRR